MTDEELRALIKWELISLKSNLANFKFFIFGFWYSFERIFLKKHENFSDFREIFKQELKWAKNEIREVIKEGIWHVCPNCHDLIKDLEHIREEAGSVYYEVTGGMMSYPTYYAKDVIALADEYNEKQYREFYEEIIMDIIEDNKDTVTKEPLVKALKDYFESMKD